MKLQYVLGILISLFFLYSCAPYNCCRTKATNEECIEQADCISNVEKSCIPSDEIVVSSIPPDCSEKKMEKIIKVTGKGLAPETAVRIGEAMILGERAAILDGYRQISERVKGTLIDSYSSRNGVDIDMDKIRAQTQAYLRGVEILGVSSNEHGVCSAEMQLRLPAMYAMATKTRKNSKYHNSRQVSFLNFLNFSK